MRKALVVGIDHYTNVTPLTGCVNDAYAVKAVLERHADGSVNFGVRGIFGLSDADVVEQGELREAIEELFKDENEIALLYFAGHGHLGATGGYISPGDTKTGLEGIPIAEIVTLAALSKSKNRIIILDCCHGGVAASKPTQPTSSELAEGMTILTASTANQYASEKDNSGVFTTLLVDAMQGAAANLLGDVTPGSVYAHVDQSLGPWAQRPVFKTNVESFVSLRSTTPPIPLADLQRLPEFFPSPGFEYALDPSYEPESRKPDPRKTAIFDILQKYNRVNLLVPLGAPHMWHAAMQSKSCKLTALGEHYRKLVEGGLI